jgi:hypothetical protein
MDSLSQKHDTPSGCGWSRQYQIWRVDMDVLNKRLRTGGKFSAFSEELGMVDNFMECYTAPRTYADSLKLPTQKEYDT